MSKVWLMLARFVVAVPFAFILSFLCFYLGGFSDSALVLSVFLFLTALWVFVKVASLTDGQIIEGKMIYKGPSDGGYLFIYQGLSQHFINVDDPLHQKTTKHTHSVVSVLRSIPCDTPIWVRAWKFRGQANILSLGGMYYFEK